MEAESPALSSAPLASPLAPEKSPPKQHPPMLVMVMEAVKTLNERKGVSVVAIKRYILSSYPAVDRTRLKYSLKLALAKGLERGRLIRPSNSSAVGATGRFKLGTEAAKRKKSPEKQTDLDGKTMPKSKKLAQNPKAKVPVKNPRLGATAEGEEEEETPSTSTKASKPPSKAPAKPKAKKPPEGKKGAETLKQSSSKAFPPNAPSAPQEATAKESKMGGRGQRAPQTNKTKGEKAKAGQEPKPPRAKGRKNAASHGPKEA